MSTTSNPGGAESDNEVDVVVSRIVGPDREEEFKAWITRLEPEIARFPGLLAFRVVEPRRGVQDEFVVLNRWADAASLEAWETSEVRARLFAEADQISERPGGVQHVSGMQGVFTLPDTQLSVAPAKYKMALIIFSGLFLLTLAWTILGTELMTPIPVVLRVAIMVGINVFLMVYLYLPAATRLLFRWLR